jgi:hypothetical protein
VYGAHFVVYMEAAWLAMNRHLVTASSADSNSQRIDDPRPWLARAAQICQRTPDDLRRRIEMFVYQQFDGQNNP